MDQHRAAPPRIVRPRDGDEGFLGSIGVRFLLDGGDAGGRFSLLEHPMSPRALAAPLHRHTHEDEYSFVLEGRMGALLGDDVVEAGPGALVVKPRGQWHTFWNAGDTPCRILELISPAGFEQFFREITGLGPQVAGRPNPAVPIHERYGLEVRPETLPELLDRFGLRLGEHLTGGWSPPVS